LNYQFLRKFAYLRPMNRTLTRKVIKIEYEEEEEKFSAVKPISNIKTSRSLNITKSKQ